MAGRSGTRFAWRPRMAVSGSSGNRIDFSSTFAGQCFFQMGSTAPPRKDGRVHPDTARPAPTEEDRPEFRASECGGAGRGDRPGFFWFPAAMDPLQQYLAKPWLKFYQAGVPPSVEIEARPVFQLFDDASARWPGRDALIFYGRGITYRELRDAIDRLACALADLGVKKGDRVALYLVNSPQFVIAYFAALKCGATVTPISPVYTSHEVRYQLEDSGARAVICQDVLYEKVAKAGVVIDLLVVTNVGEYLPAFKRLFSRKIQTPPQAHRLQDLLKRHPPRPPDIALDPKTDIAALPYTGGTTGNPKGVMLTHYNLVAALVGAP